MAHADLEEKKMESKVAKPVNLVAAENTRATLIVRKIPETTPGALPRYVVKSSANTIEYPTGTYLSAEQVTTLTKQPDIHVTVES